GEDAAPAFAARLRRHREAAGLSQEALAERAGLSAGGIGALERGVRSAPQRETVRRLARGLGLSPADAAALEAAVARTRGPLRPPGGAPAAAAAPTAAPPPPAAITLPTGT